VAAATADAEGRFTVTHQPVRATAHQQGVTYVAQLADGSVPRPDSNLECFSFRERVAARTFDETGYTVRGRMLVYWQEHSGLPVFGYPLSPERQEEGRTVQYFERRRFELHPDNPSPYDVLFGRLGAELLARRGVDWQAAAPEEPQDGCRFFAVTGRNVCDQGDGIGFRTYWTNHGLELDGQPGTSFAESLALFGYPLTNAAAFTNPDGDTILSQWFERARFEWHPDNPQEYRVLLGRLGAEIQDARPQPAPDPTPAPAPTAQIRVPEAGTQVTLPLHIHAEVGEAGQEVTAALRQQDGSELLARQFTTLAGPDGRGLLITSVYWGQEIPPNPPTQPVTLELHDQHGAVLAEQALRLLSRDDPNTQVVSLYWRLDFAPDGFDSEQQRIVRTEAIATAALEELLWGPVPGNPAGFQTAIPTPQEVLDYPDREAHWGSRVTLRNLTIENGVATADFSRELRAYGGGSTRVQAIREQITRALREFPTVDEVVIAIEGETAGILQP
jgi:hypothetical protein